MKKTRKTTSLVSPSLALALAVLFSIPGITPGLAQTECTGVASSVGPTLL